MPAPIALAWAGRLPDLGYEIGGAVARGPTTSGDTGGARRAYELLARASGNGATILLNRGHALLSLGRPADALADFKAAADHSPGEPLTWLGMGLAQFSLDHFTDAERSFRQCLSLDPNNVAARMNLAMTLEEAGRTAGAIEAWEQLLSSPLPEPGRETVRHHLDELRRSGSR
jgi:tetratricopeptide (TPR) repeat protein